MVARTWSWSRRNPKKTGENYSHPGPSAEGLSRSRLVTTNQTRHIAFKFWIQQNVYSTTWEDAFPYLASWWQPESSCYHRKVHRGSTCRYLLTHTKLCRLGIHIPIRSSIRRFTFPVIMIGGSIRVFVIITSIAITHKKHSSVRNNWYVRVLKGEIGDSPIWVMVSRSLVSFSTAPMVSLVGVSSR